MTINRNHSIDENTQTVIEQMLDKLQKTIAEVKIDDALQITTLIKKLNLLEKMDNAEKYFFNFHYLYILTKQYAQQENVQLHEQIIDLNNNFNFFSISSVNNANFKQTCVSFHAEVKKHIANLLADNYKKAYAAFSYLKKTGEEANIEFMQIMEEHFLKYKYFIKNDVNKYNNYVFYFNFCSKICQYFLKEDECFKARSFCNEWKKIFPEKESDFNDIIATINLYELNMKKNCIDGLNFILDKIKSIPTKDTIENIKNFQYFRYLVEEKDTHLKNIFDYYINYYLSILKEEIKEQCTISSNNVDAYLQATHFAITKSGNLSHLVTSLYTARRITCCELVKQALEIKKLEINEKEMEKIVNKILHKSNSHFFIEACKKLITQYKADNKIIQRNMVLEDQVGVFNLIFIEVTKKIDLINKSQLTPSLLKGNNKPSHSHTKKTIQSSIKLDKKSDLEKEKIRQEKILRQQKKQEEHQKLMAEHKKKKLERLEQEQKKAEEKNKLLQQIQEKILPQNQITIAQQPVTTIKKRRPHRPKPTEKVEKKERFILSEEINKPKPATFLQQNLLRNKLSQAICSAKTLPNDLFANTKISIKTLSEQFILANALKSTGAELYIEGSVALRLGIYCFYKNDNHLMIAKNILVNDLDFIILDPDFKNPDSTIKKIIRDHGFISHICCNEYFNFQKIVENGLKIDLTLHAPEYQTYSFLPFDEGRIGFNIMVPESHKIYFDDKNYLAFTENLRFKQACEVSYQGVAPPQDEYRKYCLRLLKFKLRMQNIPCLYESMMEGYIDYNAIFAELIKFFVLQFNKDNNTPYHEIFEFIKAPTIIEGKANFLLAEATPFIQALCYALLLHRTGISNDLLLKEYAAKITDELKNLYSQPEQATQFQSLDAFIQWLEQRMRGVKREFNRSENPQYRFSSSTYSSTFYQVNFNTAQEIDPKVKTASLYKK